MASFNKFEQFVTDLSEGVHDAGVTADTDTMKVYLSNATPSTSLDLIKTDLAEISAGNGYTAGGEDTANAVTESNGTITVVGTDITWTASGGAIAQFRYAVLYNDTPSGPVDPLIGWWDNGSAVDLATGESWKLNFGASMFTIA